MTRGVPTLTLALLALVVSVSCADPAADSAGESGPAPQPTAEIADPVGTAIAVAEAVEADPDRAAEILAEHGLTEEAFDDLMYRISSDPELRKAYSAARAGGS